MQFLLFFYLFFLPVLSRLFFTSRTPNKDQIQNNSFTFSSFMSYNPETFMSSAVSASVHTTRKRSQKMPHTKSGASRFPWTDSQWFKHHSIAHVLLYNNMSLEQSFSIERFQSYTALKITKFQYNRMVFSISSWRFLPKNKLYNNYV